MGQKIFLGLSLAAFMTINNVMAEDLMVQSISQGACWVEQGEILKITSFNDRTSMSVEKENLEYSISDLLGVKNKTKSLLELSLHCGGYGASLVARTTYQGLPACVWFKMNKGQLEVRSLGGLETTKGDLCDGYKWGELIVGLKTREQKELLQSDPLIQSITVVSGTTMKVVLKNQYRGKEAEAMEEIKKNVDVKYVELNFYQHPVGDFLELK